MEENIVGLQPEGERWDPLGAANDDVPDEIHEEIIGNKEFDECQGCSHWFV